MHKDGWFLAYYLNADPIGKMINWAAFNEGIPTKFEAVLATMAAAAGLPTPQTITYYDFRYPNATKMLLLYEDGANGNEFRIKVPNSYFYYARSASSVVYYPLLLDDKTVIQCGEPSCWADIAATDFAPEVFHTIKVGGSVVMALLHRDTP